MAIGVISFVCIEHQTPGVLFQNSSWQTFHLTQTPSLWGKRAKNKAIALIRYFSSTVGFIRPVQTRNYLPQPLYKAVPSSVFAFDVLAVWQQGNL